MSGFDELQLWDGWYMLDRTRELTAEVMRRLERPSRLCIVNTSRGTAFLSWRVDGLC